MAKLSFSPYLPNSPLSPTFMGPLDTALCFASLAIVAKLSFSPYLPNSPLSPTFMGPLLCFVFCLVGDCGKIVIFAILPNSPFSPTFMGPLQIALCFASLTIVAKLSFSPYLPTFNSPLSPIFMGTLHCFVFCLVGDCGKIVIFAILAKLAVFANFYGAPSLLCALPRLTIVAKLSFSPYLPNSPLSANFYGNPSLLCALPRWRLWQNCHSFAIFAKFAAFVNFYGAAILLCALPRWRLWENCHFRHICQIRRFRKEAKHFYGASWRRLFCVLPHGAPIVCNCGKIVISRHYNFPTIRRFRQLLWGRIFSAL